MKPQLPPVIENYVRAINSHDPASFVSLFAADAVVDDIGREFRGTAAIKGWSDHSSSATTGRTATPKVDSD